MGASEKIHVGIESECDCELGGDHGHVIKLGTANTKTEYSI